MSERPARVIVGGVGYRHLRDHSLGVAVADALAARAWPDHITVEDLSYNPVAVAQRLDDEQEWPFTRAIFIAATERPGRAPGTLAAYRWDAVLPAPEEVHRAVCDAVTGVISVDNTVIVTRQLGALPDAVALVEVEPLLHAHGDGFSPIVATAFDAACDCVAALAMDAARFAELPLTPLGGGLIPAPR